MRRATFATAVIGTLGVFVVVTLGCGGPPSWGPSPPSASPAPAPGTTVTVEFGGRLVNADAGGAAEGVQVSLDALSTKYTSPPGWVFPKNTATSGGDGTFALPLNLPSDWRFVSLKFTGPAGYDDTGARFEPTAAPCHIAPCWAVADRPTIKIYPTLVIRPGESIEARIDGDIVLCGMALVDLVPCRRVMVAASPGDTVELEIVPHDSSKPMTLALIADEIEFPEVSTRHLVLKVPPGDVPYVISDSGTGTATLTARR